MTADPDRRWFARWIVVVTAGESVGFLAPAIVGATFADTAWFVPLLIAAGAVEGAVLAAAQLVVLRSLLPRIRAARWVWLTAVGAVAAYLLGLLPSTLAPMWTGWAWPAQGLFFLVLGALLLSTIGAAQWVELRRHVADAGWWIVGTAAAWLVALALFLTVATTLWHEGQDRLATIAVGVGAGILMAVSMATVTGITLREMLRRQPGSGRGGQ